MARGFVYLVAVIDWYSCRVLSWRLSNTLDSQFCVDAWRTLSPHTVRQKSSTPTRVTSSPARSSPVCLKREGIQISMDGKGCWLDNVFIERLWRSVKYEEVYLKAYDNVGNARQSLDAYFRFYNERRRHQSIDR
jgi:putative transposase